MQIKDVRPESFVKQIRCDCCGNLSELGEVEFHESVSIDLKAGYGSIFGDGNDVQVDLCQHCLKTTLGPWLRISDAASRHAVFEQRLFRFGPDQHGGEKPTAADESMQAPEDLPAQQHPVRTVPLGIQQRFAPAWRFIGHSVRLFFAPPSLDPFEGFGRNTSGWLELNMLTGAGSPCRRPPVEAKVMDRSVDLSRSDGPVNGASEERC